MNHDLKALRARKKVKVETCVDFPNKADQSARLDMRDVLLKFRTGQPLGISGRTGYIFDQVLKNGDPLDKPLDGTDHVARSIDAGDALVAMKRLDARIKDAVKASKGAPVGAQLAGAKQPASEPVKGSNEPLNGSGVNVPPPPGGTPTK